MHALVGSVRLYAYAPTVRLFPRGRTAQLWANPNKETRHLAVAGLEQVPMGHVIQMGVSRASSKNMPGNNALTRPN